MAGLKAQCFMMMAVFDGHGRDFSRHLAQLKVFDTWGAGLTVMHRKSPGYLAVGLQYGMGPARPQAVAYGQILYGLPGRVVGGVGGDCYACVAHCDGPRSGFAIVTRLFHRLGVAFWQ